MVQMLNYLLYLVLLERGKQEGRDINIRIFNLKKTILLKTSLSL